MSRKFVVLALFAVVLPAWAHQRDWDHGHRHGRAQGQVAVAAGKPMRTTVVVNKHRFGTVDTDVKPKTTEIWVDDVYHGTCDAYDGSPDKLYLRPGQHRLLLVTPDGVEVRREVRVLAGERINLRLDLR